MRRMLFVLFSAAAVAIGAAQEPSPNPPDFLYAAVGAELATYDVGASNGVLTKRSSVTLPFAVQYIWHHPSTRYLYAAWSNGMQGDRHGITAYRIDTAKSIAGLPHGERRVSGAARSSPKTRSTIKPRASRSR